MTDEKIKITRSLTDPVETIPLKNLLRTLRKDDYSNKPIYEFIDTDTKYIRPYFDVDCPATDSNKIKILNKAVKYICTSFDVPEDELSISDSSNNDKISYHIIINSIKTTPYEMRLFKKENSDDFKKNNLDVMPYGKTQKFRIVTTSKQGQNRPLIPVNYADDLKKHLITYTDDAKFIYGDEEPKEKVSKEKVSKEKEPDKKESIETEIQKIPYEKLSKCVKSLQPQRADDYATWVKCLMCITNVAYENGYEATGRLLCHKFSMQSSKYSEDDTNKKLNELKYEPAGVKFPTLMKMLKDDNINEHTNLDIYSYEETKKEFEKTHFKCMTPSAYGRESDGDLILKKRRDMMENYENKMCIVETPDGKHKKTVFIKEWFKDKDIRTYDEIIFHPNCTRPNVYNLFTGLRAEKLKISDDLDDVNIDIIFEHISVMVNHDKQSIEYFEAWMAQIIQEPEKLPGVALVFKSEQGAGKNIFINWFGEYILGEKYFFSTAEIDRLLGRFSNGQKNKLLINLDETSGKDTFMHSEKIKHALTSDKITYEQKGIDHIELNNHARWIFTTNNNTPIKVEQKDRRMVLYETSNEKCIVGDKTGKNKIYFSDLRKAMMDERVQKKFYNYLKNLDISEVDFINDRPITALYKDVQGATVPPIVKFLETIINGGADKKQYNATSFFEKFQEFITKFKFKVDTNIVTFSRDVLRYEGITKKRSNRGMVYDIEIQVLKKYLTSKGLIEDDSNVEFLEDVPESDDDI